MDSDVVRLEWFEGAGELINRSAKTTPEGIKAIEKAIRKGTLMLYGIKVDGHLIGILTARIDRTYTNDKEFVCINVVEIKKTDKPYILRLNPVMDYLARLGGCSRVLVHSERKGMSRRFERDGGFTVLETIYQREVA